jgi:SAM-dependent methyltransferase
MYFFNKDEIKALRKDMFLLSSGNRYRFKLRLIPISNLLVISSPAKHEGRFDYVHIGYDTFTLWNFLKKKLKREKVANALEIGCGAGFLSLWMSRFADSVTAADINQKALDLTSLNARINNINNIITVKSDVYTRLNGKYNFIISNPPFELLPDDKKNSLHAYGGHLGMEITCKILSGLDAHLKKDGIAYIMANSYIKKSGQDTLNNEIENILGRQCFAVTMFEFSYQIKPGQCFFYKSHGISHSIAYLIQIQRSERFSLTVIQLKGISRLKENLRVKLLSHLCKNDV